MALSEKMAQISIVEDSSSGGPFEGPEKLLELWFAPSEDAVPNFQAGDRPRRGDQRWPGLRQVGRPVWDSMLGEVCCKVLSVIEGEDVDAYLLSESSMFVWPHKLILKTCGTTTLLLGLPTLLRIASEVCGFPGVWRCFYSRKTFMFPERQRGPHKAWTDEMHFLDQLFENSSAYTVGRMNGDHWLLYITPPRSDVLVPTSLPLSTNMSKQSSKTPLTELSASFPPSLRRLPSEISVHQVSNNSFPPTKSRPDQTLEILMTALDPSVCESFYHPSTNSSYSSPLVISSDTDAHAHQLGGELSDKLGLTALFPKDTALDSFLFEPCGFSQNAVRRDRYATVHVTPEVEYSYASFETNFDFLGHEEGKGVDGASSVQELLERVLSIFKPARLSITLFLSDEEGEEEVENSKKKDELFDISLLKKQYERVDRSVSEYDGYSLTFVSLVRAKST